MSLVFLLEARKPTMTAGCTGSYRATAKFGTNGTMTAALAITTAVKAVKVKQT